MNITAIGEILFDVYPERKVIGGAPFNFIHHVKHLTGKGDFVSRIGKDKDGEEILQYVRSAGFNDRYIQFDEAHPTGRVSVDLNDSKVPEFNIHSDAAYEYISFNNDLESLIKEKMDLLYFGTLAQKGKVTRHTVGNLWGRDIKYFCDLNLRQNYYTEDLIFKCLENSDVLKVNEDELKIINDLFLSEKFDLANAAGSIIRKFSLELLTVTVGSQGAHLFNAEESSHYKSEVNNIVDTVGAGDAYAAMLCIGYMNKWNISRTNKLAGDFAAAVCKINGAIPGSKDFYNNFINKIDS